MTGKNKPAPRADTEDRARDHRSTRPSRESEDAEQTDFAVTHIAIRCHLSLSLARVVDAGGPRKGPRMSRSIDFAKINRAALAAFPAVLARILPGGKRVGKEVVALNPRRPDRNIGSFKINRYNSRWADFATGDKGGDPISLVAYLADVSQSEAARLLARMLGIGCGGDDGRP